MQAGKRAPREEKPKKSDGEAGAGKKAEMVPAIMAEKG